MNARQPLAVIGASESALAAAAGTPALDGLGPVGGGFHSVREYLELSSVTPRLYLFAKLLIQLGARARQMDCAQAESRCAASAAAGSYTATPPPWRFTRMSASSARAISASSSRPWSGNSA